MGDAAFVMNLLTPDNGETFVVEVSNGTLTSLQGFLSDEPDLTLTIARADLEKAMIGVVPLQQQVAEEPRCSRATRRSCSPSPAC